MSYQEALKRIKEAKEAKATSLDLSGLQIAEIPVEVSQLTQLKQLWLSSNQISEIRGLAPLTQLTHLLLDSNQISEIRDLAPLTQLKQLRLDSNQISEIKGLAPLTKLTQLRLSGNQISEIKGLAPLTQLKQLRLSSNQISEIKDLALLTRLTHLLLDGNQITEIKGLAPLTQLKQLRLSSNQISEIKDLAPLTRLTHLLLDGNQISEIKGLAPLTQLKQLRLSSNQISEIKGLAPLTRLTHLLLDSNQISEIKGLAPLTQLKQLRLDRNKISEIKGLESLTQLTHLWLSSNQINEIKGLAPLTQLTHLSLDSNQISEIKGLAPLTQLMQLRLDRNKINEIKGLESLTQLTHLWLSSNQIQIVPLSLLNLTIKWETLYVTNGIAIRDNPVNQPPIDIVKQGNDAIRRYWEEIAEKGVDYLYEAKLILVGDGGAGKTTLLHRLQGRNEATERTRGVEIEQHSFKNRQGQAFNLNIWDFGGQDIYYAVHRFFLTENSLYLLLTSTRSPEDNFDYWIPNIALFGGKSPIAVIKNKWEGFQRDISIKRFVREEEFYVINQIFEADLLGGTGFPKIKKAIYDHTQNLPHIGQAVPKTWIKVRNALKEIDSKIAYVPFERFELICNENDIADPEMIKDLARYFHDLGIALWYHKIPQLADKIILQPEWVTEAVYKVVDDQEVQDNKGHFDHSDLSRLWKEDTYQGMQHQLIELMKAFRLCYQKRGRKQYIIPALLIQEEATEFWTPERCLQVEYDYLFLPKGIVNQLTAELHQDIKSDKAVWSRGVILETELAEARVVEDWYKRKVSIEVKGAGARGLLQIIMRELEAINDTYAGMKVTKMVPCICGYCQEAEEVKRFKYDKLVQKLKRGKQFHTCDEDDEVVALEELLLNVGYQYNQQWQSTTDATAPSVFFSYANEDEGIRAALEKQLIQLKRKKEIVIWSSREILAGQHKSQATNDALEKADVVIQLISAHYINSLEIMDGECARALEKSESGEVHLIPIQVKPCLWDSAIPATLQILPRSEKALSTFSDQDEIMVEVAREIIGVINEVRKKKST